MIRQTTNLSQNCSFAAYVGPRAERNYKGCGLLAGHTGPHVSGITVLSELCMIRPAQGVSA